ncbi:hypothetical protein [Anabaena sp. CCY 0017]
MSIYAFGKFAGSTLAKLTRGDLVASRRRSRLGMWECDREADRRYRLLVL